MRLQLETSAAIICRHAQTGKWIICLELGNMIESDELAARRGQFGTRKAAVAAFRADAAAKEVL